MRTGIGSVVVEGVAWERQQYFDIQFYWLCLPAALYIGTSILLIGTIFDSAARDTPLWKSSPLVLLRAMDRENNMRSVDQVEEEARSTAVELKYTGKGWYLRGRDKATSL